MPREYSCAQRYGVAIFESPKELSSGWACVFDEEPYYITSTGDLYTNVIWLTNIDLRTLYEKGLSQSPKLRPDNFLRTRLSSIMIELGIKFEEPRIQAISLAKLFSTTMQFMFLHIGLSTAPAGTLNNGIRQACMPDEQSMTPDVKSAAEQAIQPHVLCEKSQSENGCELSSLVFHRFSYATNMLSHSLPIGAWEPVKTILLKQDTASLNAWLSTVNQPAMLEVVITSVDLRINHLINYGSGAGLKVEKSFRGTEAVIFNARSWMTAPEYFYLTQFADMKIKNILIGKGYGMCPLTIPKWGSVTEGSYAFGLYCENLWTSLTRSLDGRSSKSPIGAWIHSLDRLYCLKKALAISEKEKVTIHSYGYGRITFQIPVSDKGAFPKLALRQKMIAPMPSPSETATSPIPNNASHAELMQIAMERGANQYLERADQAALDLAIQHYERKTFNTNNNILAM